jgi:hypothetical protein
VNIFVEPAVAPVLQNQILHHGSLLFIICSWFQVSFSLLVLYVLSSFIVHVSVERRHAWGGGHERRFAIPADAGIHPWFN